MSAGVPQAEMLQFHARERDIALIVGVYNEGARFAKQINALQPYRKLVDIIVADGGSSDGASSYDALKDKARCLIINTDEQRGLSVQYRSALHYACEQGYEGIIMMDGNGKDGVDAIPLFISKLKEGYDFVQGSRFLPGGRHENTPLDRVLGIRYVFNPVINVGAGFHYTDGMNGFKAVSRRLLLDPRVQPFRNVFVRYSLQYYLNYISPRLGFKVTEIPVSRSYIKDGKPHSKIVGLRARAKIIGEMLGTVLGHYNVR